MRFLSLLAIASIAFCVSMCTPNNSNNVTPATGNCRDGIQNGDEQGVDCGANVTGTVCFTCNGNMTITAAGTSYSTGHITTTNSSGTCYTTNPPTTALQYPLVIVTPTFYKNGSLSSALSMYLYIRGTPTVKSYTYESSIYCIGGNINTFYIQSISGTTTCSPTSGTGTLNITGVNTTTRKMSGNFSATLQCSGNYPISGTFTDVSY